MATEDLTYKLTYPYHIVEFISAGRKPRNKSIDIVCTTWMFYDNKKKKMVVKYPSPPYTDESWVMYNDHLKYQFDALSDWKEYSIRIKGKAGKHCVLYKIILILVDSIIKYI